MQVASKRTPSTRTATVRADRALATRYARNAATHIAAMLADREVMVGDRKVRVTSLADARKIKLGKLKRHLGIMNAAAPHPGSREHKVAVATWNLTAVLVSRVTTMTALRAMAGGK